MIDPAILGVYSDILASIKMMFPGSNPVIGGGALRDAYHGRPIKDVDVFLRAKDHPFGITHQDIKTIVPANVGYGLRSDMHGVWDVTVPINGFQVQLIVADFEDLFDLAPTFDLGFSRVTFDGTSVFYHPHFWEDSFNKEFVIRRSDDDGTTARSERRIERLAEKYPDWKRAA